MVTKKQRVFRRMLSQRGEDDEEYTAFMEELKEAADKKKGTEGIKKRFTDYVVIR